jgi:hypothetical protein
MVDDPQSFLTVDASEVIRAAGRKDKSIGKSRNDYVEEKQTRFPGWDETLVIVKCDKTTAFVGRLVEINSNCLTFDYVLLDSSMAVYIHSFCEVYLRNCYNPGINFGPIICRVVSDTYIRDRSYFDIPMKRCNLEVTRQLSLSEIQSYLFSP